MGRETNTSFTFTIPANGGWAYIAADPTVPTALQSGYATLQCSADVYASLEFSLYEQGKKTGGATVASNGSWYEARYVADQIEFGSRLGIAIANNADLPKNYRIDVRNLAGSQIATTTITVQARQSTAKFLDEIVSGTQNSLTHVTITSTDFSSFASIGLRFVGSVFTTIPSAQ